mmetsp:Transcript_89067/g.212654  ORF Transcript_89067/g.212654 Transcript_89067/m.212654 type:complete len:425 (+) Transcript_89067:1196-2470(+)
MHHRGDDDFPILARHLGHQSKVQQAELALVRAFRDLEEVAGMRVPVKEANVQELGQEHLLANGDQLLDLRRGQCAELHPVHPLREHHAATRLLHQRCRDDHLLQRRGLQRLFQQLLHAQRVQRLVPEVQLRVETLSEGLREGDVVRLIRGEAADQGLHHVGEAAEHVEVLGHRAESSRPLDLHGHLLPGGPQRGAVDLRQGGRGDRLIAEGRKDFIHGLPHLLLNDPASFLSGESLDVVLQSGQLFHGHRRQHVRANGQHLPQLHKGRAQLLHVVDSLPGKAGFILPDATIQQGVEEPRDEGSRNPQEAAPSIRQLPGLGVPELCDTIHGVDQRQALLVHRVGLVQPRVGRLLGHVALPVLGLRKAAELCRARRVLARLHRLFQQLCAGLQGRSLENVRRAHQDLGPMLPRASRFAGSEGGKDR